MALTPGTRLGTYEVTGRLGAGGMGEVYRARDAKLHRDVALKALPEAFATDPERLARFEREAQVLASLNHPHIAAIYGLEEAGGTRAIVMELVEGPTLADRIARGAIPIDEALPIARQIAEALEAAHEQGIIHRDLKPANIKVREDGTVKVLDFGLAKALDPAPGSGAAAALVHSPTITSPAAMTGMGVILGTAAYMSPEQAKGRPVDRRADLWAFGCVVYEMLTGVPAFGGDDATETIAAVVRAEPDWSRLPAATPQAVRMLLARCLQKDRSKRLDSAAVARIEIDELRSVGAEVTPPATGRSRWRVAAVAATALVSAGALAAFGALAWQSPVHAPTVRLSIAPRPPEALSPSSSVARRRVAVSPDGSTVVYVAGPSRQLMARRLDQVEAVPLGDAEGVEFPFFSPDSKWVGFFTSDELRKVAVEGGPAITLCRTTGPGMGASWAGDGAIYFAMGNTAGVLRMPAGGGNAELLFAPDTANNESAFRFVEALPGGSALLLTDWDPSAVEDNARVLLHDLRTGERRVLIERASQAVFLDTGHLVYARMSALLAVPFDLETMSTTGDAVPAIQGVTASYGFATSKTGTLVYVASDGESGGAYRRSLSWVDRDGHEQPIPTPARPFLYPRVSPDGARIAVDLQDEERDIWLLDSTGSTSMRRLTFGPSLDGWPTWTSDGRRIVFTSEQPAANLFWQSADGSGSAVRASSSSNQQHPYSASADGRFVLFKERFPGSGNALSLHSTRAGEPPTPLVQLPPGENNADLSPDGRWLAYQSRESGRDEIYVRPAPNVDQGRWQVSSGGGAKPVWTRDGKELLFLVGGLLTSVQVQTSPTFQSGAPVTVLKTPYWNNAPGRTWDVSPDGKRFLMVKAAAGESDPTNRPDIVVVLNWFDELRQRVPVR